MAVVYGLTTTVLGDFILFEYFGEKQSSQFLEFFPFDSIFHPKTNIKTNQMDSGY